MLERIRGHITAPMLLAFVALFMAIGGAALAAKKAKKNTVVTKSIKNLAVKSSKLADGSVTTPKLADGAVTAPKVTVTARSATVNVPTGGTYAEATANCEAGEKVVGGGADYTDNAAINEFTTVLESGPAPSGQGWYARGQNAFVSDRTLKVTAFCLGA